MFTTNFGAYSRAVWAILAILVHSQSANAQFRTVINVPPDVAPQLIEAETQLNLYEGGHLPRVFAESREPNAYAEVNVFGGAVDSLTIGQVARLNMFGGYAEVLNVGVDTDVFGIYSGGEAQIAAGEIDTLYVYGSRVQILGGRIRQLIARKAPESLACAPGCEIPASIVVSGGSVEFRTLPSTLQGASLEVLGSSFLIGDQVITGLVDPGDSIVLSGQYDATLRATLTDGSPFALDLSDLGELNVGPPSSARRIRLTLVPEPTAGSLLWVTLAIAASVARRPSDYFARC